MIVESAENIHLKWQNDLTISNFLFYLYNAILPTFGEVSLIS